MAMDWGKLFGSAGGLGSLFGNAGDIMGTGGAIASLTGNDNAENGLGIGSGLAGLASNSLGLYDTAVNEQKGTTRNLGFAEGAFGLLGSGADLVGGALGLKGNKKGSDIASYVSGAANLLGGGASLWKAFSQYKEGKTGDAIMSGLGGVGKIFSGITGIGSTASDKKGWKIANLASSIFGTLLGGAGTVMDAQKDPTEGGGTSTPAPTANSA